MTCSAIEVVHLLVRLTSPWIAAATAEGVVQTDSLRRFQRVAVAATAVADGSAKCVPVEAASSDVAPGVSEKLGCLEWFEVFEE